MSRARMFRELLDSFNATQSKREQFYDAVEKLVADQDAEIARLRAALEQRDHDLRANLVRAYVFEPVEQQKILDALRAEVESLKAIVYQKDVLTDTAAQANDILRQRALKAEAVVRAAEAWMDRHRVDRSSARASVITVYAGETQEEAIQAARCMEIALEDALAAFRERA